MVQLEQRRGLQVHAGCHDGGRRAVRKQRRSHDRVGIVGGPDVQGAQLGAHDQHNRRRVRLAEGLGRTERRKRRVAAHEAQVVALHRGVQAQGADDLVVRAGVEKSGAGDRDEVSDVQRINAVAFGYGRVRRVDEKLRCFLGEEVVACLGAGAAQQAGRRDRKTGDFRPWSPGSVRGPPCTACRWRRNQSTWTRAVSQAVSGRAGLRTRHGPRAG